MSMMCGSEGRLGTMAGVPVARTIERGGVVIRVAPGRVRLMRSDDAASFAEDGTRLHPVPAGRPAGDERRRFC